MSETTLSMQVEKSLKENFDKMVVEQQLIPYDINTKGWEAFMQMRKQVADAGVQDLSLDEINAIIKDVRNGN